jgi:hypothetical protein
MSLLDTIKTVQPSVLLGLTACGGLFTHDVIKEMAHASDQPIIFPLSNPTKNAECSAKDVYGITEGAYQHHFFLVFGCAVFRPTLYFGLIFGGNVLLIKRCFMLPFYDVVGGGRGGEMVGRALSLSPDQTFVHKQPFPLYSAISSEIYLRKHHGVAAAVLTDCGVARGERMGKYRSGDIRERKPVRTFRFPRQNGGALAVQQHVHFPGAGARRHRLKGQDHLRRDDLQGRKLAKLF